MLDGSNPPRIKVCDFGFSKNWEDDVNMFTQVRAALQGGGALGIRGLRRSTLQSLQCRRCWTRHSQLPLSV